MCHRQPTIAAGERSATTMLSSIAFIRSPTVAPWSTTIAEGKKGVIQLCVSVYVT